MLEIFESLSNGQEITLGLLYALIIEPLITVIGIIIIVIFSYRHFRRTSSKGGLFILLSLVIGLFLGILSSILEETISENYLWIVDGAIPLSETFLFIMFVYGFKLICESSEQSIAKN
tara:strand:+ start:3662 stop:4015 length:354 start_codon:yes stop_codon:yes gene_type:complete